MSGEDEGYFVGDQMAVAVKWDPTEVIRPPEFAVRLGVCLRLGLWCDEASTLAAAVESSECCRAGETRHLMVVLSSAGVVEASGVHCAGGTSRV